LISCLVWDEDVLNVEHVLTFMTVLGACVAGARVFIPDENLGKEKK
jgi:autophagy-related protein 9